MKKPDDDCAFDPRAYLRRPDRAFWLDLLSPMPHATEVERQRRERLTRYSLGAAFLISAFYLVLTLAGTPLSMASMGDMPKASHLLGTTMTWLRSLMFSRSL